MSNTPRIEGAKAINVLRVASAGVHAQGIVIGADQYALTTRDDLAVAAGKIAVDVHAGTTVKARGRITFGGLPVDGETVTIGGKIYTFLDTLTGADGEVLIGSDAEAMVDALIAAINLSAGAGVLYGLATVKHTTVTALKSSTDKVIVRAIVGGTPGNAITLAEAATNVTKDAATLGTELLGVDPSAENVVDALLAAINGDAATERVEGRKISANELLIAYHIVGERTIACTETLTGANNAWASATMYGGKIRKWRRMFVDTRVPNAVEVAVGNIHIELDFTPTIYKVHARITATPGIFKAWDGGVTISGKHVTIDNGGSVDWAETDTLEIELFE